MIVDHVTATVQVTVKLNINNRWANDVMATEVAEAAERQARETLQKALGYDAVVSAPIVTMVQCTVQKG